MNNLKIVFGIVLMAAICAMPTAETTAQSSITSGHLVLEVTEVDMPGQSNNPEAEMAIEMLKGSTMEMYFTPERELLIMDMMGGMSLTKVLTDIANDRITTYMEMMGQKMKVDLGKFSNPDEDEEVDYSVEVDKNDRKEIAGFDAYKAVIKMTTQGQQMEMVCYITDEIVTRTSAIQQMHENPFPGMVLEMSMDMAGMKMKYEATSFSENFDASVFEIDDSQYREMDMETLQQMGMGGF